MNDYVDFLGIRNDVGNILSKMDIGLMLSKHEAFGRVTVEYMQHKLFTIASNTSANVEIIKDGYNGFLYEFGNEKMLMDIIENIIINKYSIMDITENAYNDAITNYSSLNNSEKIFATYINIL